MFVKKSLWSRESICAVFRLLQRFQNPTDIYQELAEADPEPCYGRKCTANEHCCPGSVCVDFDGGR